MPFNPQPYGVGWAASMADDKPFEQSARKGLARAGKARAVMRRGEAMLHR
jgi:hypothetical protein